MKRLTTKAEDGTYLVSGDQLKAFNKDSYGGEAINKLGKYENFHEALLNRRQVIPEELQKLREQGKEKSVKFRELLAEKLTIENILIMLKGQGIQG
ncbi:MAG: hypothetical protein ACOX1Y_05925 [Zhaonellaceae bacterium]